MIKQEQLKGFTLLELLIVIAILSILAMSLILVLNPAETLKKSRDTQRMTDLSTLKTAIGLYLANVTSPFLTQADNARCVGGTGAATVFYSGSVTDNTIAAGFVAESTNAGVGSVDGNGWLPINLGAISSGAPISNFPLDPVNSAANGASTAVTITDEALVYRYSCNATGFTYEVDANLESTELSVKEGSDGGNNDFLYEIGTKLDILPTSQDF